MGCRLTNKYTIRFAHDATITTRRGRISRNWSFCYFGGLMTSSSPPSLPSGFVGRKPHSGWATERQRQSISICILSNITCKQHYAYMRILILSHSFGCVCVCYIHKTQYTISIIRKQVRTNAIESPNHTGCRVPVDALR